MLGFLWLPLFRWLYRSPEEHPRLSAAERDDILANRASGRGAGKPPASRPLGYRALLSLPQTWGIVIGKALTDPVWFFITDWLAIYLVSRGILARGQPAGFLGAVPRRGSRKLSPEAGSRVRSSRAAGAWAPHASVVIVVGTLGMLMLIPAIYTTRLVLHRRVLRGRDVCIRGAVDDDPESAGGYLSDGAPSRRSAA